jgi:poly-gamma-glutamate synthesis protein (capsule biosynthesis protein)
MFAGDVMSHAPQVAAARADAIDASRAATAAAANAAPATPETSPEATSETYDYARTFRHFRPIFEQAHVAVANLETTLRAAPPYTGYPRFAAPAELAFALRGAGIDIVTTANNHICDRGAEGIRATLALLDSAGLRHTGAFLDSADRRARNPLRFSAGGLRFALLAYTYGTNGLAVPRGMIVNTIDTAVIARDLAEARAGEFDCVVVSYHWGEEYRTRPTAAQRSLAAWTRARGADLIIGGHPHVVEPVEGFWGDYPVADSLGSSGADSSFSERTLTGGVYYSLGNFVSNQRVPGTDGGIVADITVTRTVDSRDPASSATAERSGSKSASYDLGWRLAWVHTPVLDGVRRYEILPASAIDSLSAIDTFDDPAAKRFALSTRALLADSLSFRELE